MTVNDLESDQYIGLQINNYELKEKIGAGKIGGVYKAIRDDNHTVACKIIPEHKLKNG